MPRRPWTIDRRNADGSTTITIKRACNGCGEALGDATEAEIAQAIDGLPQPDVRSECTRCAPGYFGWDDPQDPTPALAAAVRAAFDAETRTAEQDALLSVYWDLTCGDCLTGKCHGTDPDECGCARHEVSALWSQAEAVPS